LTFADILPTFDAMKSLKRKTAAEIVKVGNVTVRIYKRQRTTANGKSRIIFEVADYTNGVRRLIGFTDHANARRKAETLAGQLSTGAATAATMRNSEAASYGRAIELLRPTDTSLEMAASTFAKAFKILGGDFIIEAAKFYKLHRADKVTQKTVAEIVEELIASKKARGKSAKYLTDLRYRLSKFAEAFSVNISSVTTSDVQHWLDELEAAPQSAKNFRTVLHTLFQFAESRGYVFKGGNPVTDTEAITANAGQIEIFTPEEISLLLKSASESFRPILALGAFAGLRTAEIERIEWKEIDLASGFIHVAGEKSKTRSRRLVPIVANLKQWLAPYVAATGKVWKGTNTDLHEARGATVAAAKVDWKNNGLRHSFISYRLAEIQNAAQVALEAGNSPNIVFKHYRELVKPATATTWFAISPETPENVVQLSKAAK